jgi:hypothetical protein
MARTPIKKNAPKRVLILCEGETEEIYFKSYVSEKNRARKLSAVSVQIYQPKRFTPKELLKEAERKIKEERNGIPYESVWIVFDKDQHPYIPETFRASEKLDVQIAFSAICFEYWIILHFEKTTKVFINGDAAVNYIRSKYYPEYQKAEENFFHKIKDRIDTAIQYADEIMKNRAEEIADGQQPYDFDPYTDVHILINYLKTLD